jgi:hypothetical protein
VPIAVLGMLSAGVGDGTSRIERGIAALLVGIALAGGVLIPRLLSEPASPRGVAIGAGPGRIVVETTAIAKEPRRRAVPPAVTPVGVTDAPVARVVAHIAPKPHPDPAPLKLVLTPPAALPEASTPSPPAEPAPAAAPSPTPQAVQPIVLTAPKNSGRQNQPTGRGHDLRGFRNGTSVRQASPYALGANDSGVGHLAPPPAGAAQAAHVHGAKARSEARGRGGKRSTPAPAPPVTHGYGPPPSAGNGHASDDDHANGNGRGHGG